MKERIIYSNLKMFINVFFIVFIIISCKKDDQIGTAKINIVLTDFEGSVRLIATAESSPNNHINLGTFGYGNAVGSLKDTVSYSWGGGSPMNVEISIRFNYWNGHYEATKDTIINEKFKHKGEYILNVPSNVKKDSCDTGVPTCTFSEKLN